MCLPADFSIASISKLAPDISSLLDKFPVVWNPRPPDQLPEYQVKHKIETEGLPLYAYPRHLDLLRACLIVCSKCPTPTKTFRSVQITRYNSVTNYSVQ